MKRDNGSNGSDEPLQKYPKPSADTSNVVIRFLIPCRAAGIMIGKGGENINRIRNKFNVKLHIPDNRGPERVMTIEGDLNAICDVLREVSPKLKDIINAKLSDPRRIMGNYVPRRQEDLEKEDDYVMLDYRILVHESQAGSVIGRGGERIKELRLAAPPRGRREEYDAANFSETDALNYGGWLSPEAVRAIGQGMPPTRPGGYMDPYMSGNMGMGPQGPMSHMRGSMSGGPRGPGGVRGPRPSGNMGPRSMGGGPTPVPPPGAGSRASGTGYGNGNQYDNQIGMQGYDGGYDTNAMYSGMDQSIQSGYGSQGGYSASTAQAASTGDYSASGYGQSTRVTGVAQTPAARTGTYAGYGMSNPVDDQKTAQWYGGWA